MIYFEKGCPRSQVRAARPQSTYRAQWYDTRKGAWLEAGAGWLKSNVLGVIALPEFPSDTDWGLRLTWAGDAPAGR
jgi:hypothetical protein